MPISRSSFLSFLLLFCTGYTALMAQLDTIHWLPPMYPGTTMGTQYIYIYTPESTPFSVVIEDGSGQQVTTAMVSSTQPFIYKISDSYSQLLKSDNLLHKVLPNSGLVIHGPKKFNASFRILTEDEGDACFLTYKGRAALGKVFRIGNIIQARDKGGGRFNMVGIMATENGTTISLSGFNTATLLSGASYVSSPITMQLQRGESVVFAHYVGTIFDDQPINSFMGALLETTKPVAVTCGAWYGAPVVYAANDIGIDQILPLERVGKEYIFCRGDGPTSLEHPIIMAHYDGTEVWVNGADTALATLNAGKYISIPAAFYIPTGNMFVRTSKPAFAYQMTGGHDTGKTSLNTVSLLFMPPLSCGIPHQIDNICLPNRIGPTRFDGSLQVVALRNTAVEVFFDGQPIDLGPPMTVPGNDDFVTYKAKRIFKHLEAVSSMRVVSDGAVYASVVCRKEFASYASLLTGYEYVSPNVELTLHGDGICPDTLTAHGFFDKIKWVYDDTIMQEGTDTTFIVLAPGEHKAIAYLGGCRNTATFTDSIDVPLTAPQFDFSFVEPSCYGFADGQISFSLPNGGTPPYLYSIDHGQHTATDPVIENVAGGDHKLIVQDASGCYNEPIHFELPQPDSVAVDLVAIGLPHPLRPGDNVLLEGFTNANVSSTAWVPTDTAGCANCLVYNIRPEIATWVTLTVYDENGCPGSDSLLLIVEPQVYAPNAIYPASIVGNDRFVLYSELPSPVHALLIFDRWGNQVFEQRNFLTNSPTDGWDGTHLGKNVVAGQFTYWAEVEVAPGIIVQLKGTVTVIR